MSALITPSRRGLLTGAAAFAAFSSLKVMASVGLPLSIHGGTSSGFPDSSNTGYLNASGYAGSLTPYGGGTTFSSSGTLGNPLEVDFTDFDSGSGGLVVSGSHIIFKGCRFQSNSINNYNVHVTGGDVAFSYCSVVPRVSVVSSPPNAAWPSAGAGLALAGDADHLSYQIAASQCYQYGLQLDAATGPITVDHCDIWGFANSITWLGTTDQMNVTNSWIHDAVEQYFDGPNSPAAYYHQDGPGYLNGTAGPSNVLIQGNTISSIADSNAIAFQANTSGYDNLQVIRNYLSGFGVVLSLSTANTMTGSTVKDNVIGTDNPWIFSLVHNDYTTTFHTSGNLWQNNKFKVRAGTSRYGTSQPIWTGADDGKYIWPDGTLHASDFS